MLIDAEGGQRGYLYTGEESYLKSYEEAVAHVPGMITSLRDRYQKEARALALVATISRATNAKLTDMDITTSAERDENYRTSEEYRAVTDKVSRALHDAIQAGAAR